MNDNLIIPENNPEDINMFYGDELYLIEESQWYEDIPSEGGNKYRFLNIVSHNESEMIPEKHRDMFFRMINAIQTDRIKMDADGFSVINVQNFHGLKWGNIEKNFSPKYCVFWGVDPHKMDIPCKLNGGYKKNDCKIIYINSMDVVFQNKELKKMLWDYLQRMFQMHK